ncbi:hypothetical protein NDI76_21800 [Halogeometricum sp. S1BR25-6]|uniref:Uncharacterized protein n=1 Tax=Halogeometricum salsisoli TaxID=2950536 RepID=A0ABU2GKQ7_9EURY|nr:hypothetical protein [Halogeometricum sp. S1BR25-6]MDS0301370.1 hypothetical protein [Halogeometricum sp. S1BR25-6]
MTEVGPRAGMHLEELDRELPVFVETIGGDLESGYLSIHDPDHLEPSSDYVEMTLGEALEIADDFCCDCFTTAMIDQGLERVSDL